MTEVPFIDLRTQFNHIREEITFVIGRVCESSRFALGPAVEEFEENFASYCSVKYCVCLNSGTSALHLALLCLNIGPGDEVITVPMTFISTATAISYVGAKLVFVDIDPARRTMNPEHLESAITPRTRAIIPVHLYGMPAEMGPIISIANRYGIPVVEDAAQAHGARYKGKRVGSLGRIGCFSFYPSKNLGAFGEGGCLVTNDDAIARRARRLRDHGQSKRFYHDEIGYNYRMDAFQGAVLNVKLKYLDAWNSARTSHAKTYNELLGGLRLTLPTIPEDSESAWHLYAIELENPKSLKQRLLHAGIHTSIHYPVPVHLQKAYLHLGFRPRSFPVSEKLSSHCLSLPIYPELSYEQANKVCKNITAFATEKLKSSISKVESPSK
jgi:dTDP-4-amino-4,6-dideoxygalactose transaminase